MSATTVTTIERLGGCPCLHIGACSYACTCVEPYMSGGCRRCATYGSAEQQKAQAQFIADAVDAALAKR